MPFCGNCGNEYSEGSKFCQNCGAKIGESPAPIAGGDLEDERILWEGKPSGLTTGVTSSTRYILTNERLKISSGRIGKKHEEIELLRIKDVKVKQSLSDRAQGIGNIEIISTDETTPKIVLKDVKDPADVKEIIRNATRSERSAKVRYEERL